MAEVRSTTSPARPRRPASIDPNSPVPKYHQVREILLDLISTELTFDQPIPSERELAERFSVSRMTARQAVAQLVVEGRLYRVSPKGTFVARPKIVLQLHLTSFSEDMRSRGLVPGSVDLARETVPAGSALARELDLSIGDPVHILERLRTANGEPMAIERAYIPAAVAPGLAAAPLAGRSLYEVLEERYGVVLDAGEQTVEASVVEAGQETLLAIPPGSPVLLFTRRSFSGRAPVEYVVSTYRGDRYQLRVSLNVSGRGPSTTGERS